VKPDYAGKVRDVYYISDTQLLLVASDRISAFDCVFGEPVPGKGQALTEISNAWFRALRKSGLQSKHHFQDHLISAEIQDFPEPFKSDPSFNKRSVLARRTRRIDFECIVRGHLAGSALKEYRQTGKAFEYELPAGLSPGDRLPEPIFTPTTKAHSGHDLPISFSELEKEAGELAHRLKECSLAIFNFAHARLLQADILLFDTKFEFGMIGNDLVLIDEILTPDSSRFRDAHDTTTDPASSSMDKQYLRSYLDGLDWDKTPPAPALPGDVLARLAQIYSDTKNRILKTLDQ
jgi:phosphoribosylaminoimidazole-succinocarboxamide synthase